MSKYPFLDRIPVEKRLTAMNDLDGWQVKKHRRHPDCIDDFQRGNYNPLDEPESEPIIIKPEWEEDYIKEINREMIRNTDIKEDLS